MYSLFSIHGNFGWLPESSASFFKSPGCIFQLEWTRRLDLVQLYPLTVLDQLEFMLLCARVQPNKVAVFLSSILAISPDCNLVQLIMLQAFVERQ